MRAGRSQLDVAETLTADFRQRDFHAALVADHAAVLHALVLAAQALPVGDRTEDARAEQAIALRLEGAVVDGFRLGDFAMRPAPDFLRRCQADADGIEVGNRVCHVKGARTIQGVLRFPAVVTRPPAALESVLSSGSQFCRTCLSSASSRHRERIPQWQVTKSRSQIPGLGLAALNRRTGTDNRNWFLICCCRPPASSRRGLDQFHIQAERLQFANQHVERFRHARFHGGFALDDGLVNLGAAIHVV